MADDAASPTLPSSRALRIWYGVIQTVVLSAFVRLCWISAEFETIYREIGMTKLPAPTELWVFAAPFFRTVPGSALVAAVDIALVTLGMRGTLDRILRKLIVANVTGALVLTGFFVMSVFYPIIQIQQTLSNK